MKSVISVYCSGGIKKGPSDVDKVSWDAIERNALLSALSPIKVVFLDPEHRTDDITDAFTVFGRDHYQVSVCDFVIIDARQRRGIGVGIEMLSAKWFAKPIISIAPPNSHYRRDELHYLGGTVKDYVHAHLFGISDAIVDDFSAAGLWIKDYLQSPRPIKDISVVTQAIAAYKEKQLHRDTPMLEALEILERS
jgi:hypothetical protein